MGIGSQNSWTKTEINFIWYYNPSTESDGLLILMLKHLDIFKIYSMLTLQFHIFYDVETQPPLK